MQQHNWDNYAEGNPDRDVYWLTEREEQHNENDHYVTQINSQGSK